MKDKAVLLVSVLIGLLAFWLTNQYLRSEREKLYAGAEKVKVVITSRDLPAGTVLKFEDLAQKSVFKTAVGENVVRPQEIDNILDKKLRYGLKRNEPVWWSYVEGPAGRKTGLAPMIKSGMRAVSVAIGGADAVSGLVQPNDRVDILGTFSFPSKTARGEMETVTLTLLQDVTILATGQQLANPELQGDQAGGRSSGYNTVTVEVTPREGELLIFVQHVKGQLTLALRNPEDVTFEKDLQNVNFDQVENRLPELNLYRQRNIRHKTNL